MSTDERETANRDPVDTFVIGAGPAGLTTAYLLTKAGRTVTVIERDPDYVGGISRTVRYHGFHFDIGGHRFFSKSREVVDLWDELLPDDLIDRPRLSRIYYGGKYYAYPLRAFEALWNLGVFTATACVFSYAWAQLTPIRTAKTFHQWVRNQFGERLFAIFFKTYTEKVWGMSCDEISADWAAQRIRGLSLLSAVMDGLGRSLGLTRGAAAQQGQGGGIKTLVESFRYPRKGPGMMWDAAASKTRAHGGQILMGRQLGSLTYDHAAQLWDVTAVEPDGSVEHYAARSVVSSAAIAELVPAITPRPTSHPQAVALRYRDFITVALIMPVEAIAAFPDNWIYIHDPNLRVGRIQNFLSWSPEMAPDGFACVGLEYFCFEGDGLWTEADDKLIALAKSELEKTGLAKATDIVDGCVVRQPKAYPVYDDSYLENVEAVRQDLEVNYPTLHLVGRNGMHKYNNQDHAMMTAMLSVKNILSGERKFDVWRVNEDAEYSEEGISGATEALQNLRLTPRRAEP